MVLSNVPSCISQPQKVQSLLNQLIIFFLFLLPPANAIFFNFSSLQINNGVKLTFQGDAYLDTEGLQLTKNTRSGSIIESVGRALHPEGVRLWDKGTGRVTDFTTHFSFKIKTVNESSPLSGDGLAFFIAPFNSPMPNNSGGGALGLLSREYAANGTQNPIVAVEFDTFYNPQYLDPKADHVGIDVNSMNSKNYITWPTSIKNGSTANAWVTYNSTTHNLSVFLTFADKPDFSGNYNLSYIVNLTSILPERVSVGFSAATGWASELHTILSWSFNSTLEVKDELTLPNNTRDGNRKNKLGLVIGLAVSSGVVSGALGLLWFICWRKRAGGNIKYFEDGDGMDYEFEEGTRPKRFTYYELLRATNNFAASGMLGVGGFGRVYKGFLRESNIEVAVKRVSEGSKHGKKEYISEVKISSRLRHKNLVQLIGWCHEQRELLLVYGYMPNGSLDSYLFGAKILLTWPVRYKIAHGLASALLYLHEEWEQCVVHRDIKPGNIMLDSNFNTKLGDFGLSRLVEHELGSQTTHLAGTIGYIAPECLTTGKASKESDVYSFGVVSLQIACGRKPFEAQSEPSKVMLVQWVWDLYGKGQLFEAVDKGLSMEFDEGQMECLMVVGLWCCHPDPTIRPSIRQVLHVLNFEARLPNLPSKLPVPMYFQPPMHMCEFSKASSSLIDDDDMDDEFEKGTGPKRFTYYELLHATNNFAEGGMLGEGGFGRVYKGLLRESNIEVAVKRMSKGLNQGKKEYISEVKIISRFRHKNLVQLIGWCHEQREFLLVYGYMPNGSLDSYLFRAKILLTWPVRYKIAHGLASALLYLHEEWEQCVVHRDIKPGNIMLDSNFNTKLGDFGLSRLVEHEWGSKTTHLAGTIGYIAPECLTTGKASKESDVYSFGVVSLQIACGRKPFEAQSEPSKRMLVQWVWDLYEKGQLFEAVDKGLSMEFDEGQMECLMVVGLWCCHPDPTIRPSIRQVLHFLNFEARLPNLPSKLPVPMNFQPPMPKCKFSKASSSLTSIKAQMPCSCSSCSTNSSMSADPSKPFQHSSKIDVELGSVIH